MHHYIPSIFAPSEFKWRFNLDMPFHSCFEICPLKNLLFTLVLKSGLIIAVISRSPAKHYFLSRKYNAFRIHNAFNAEWFNATKNVRFCCLFLQIYKCMEENVKIQR